MKRLLLSLLLFMSLAGPALAAEMGTFAPTAWDTAGSSANVWVNPDSTLTVDDALAVCAVDLTDADGNKSDHIDLTTLGISLPEGTSIDGVKVSVTRRGTAASGGVVDYVVQLLHGGAVIGDNKATATTWAADLETVDYGGETDDWNSGLTWEEIITTGFGVRIQFQVPNYDAAGETGSIDGVTITLYGELGGATQPAPDDVVPPSVIVGSTTASPLSPVWRNVNPGGGGAWNMGIEIPNGYPSPTTFSASAQSGAGPYVDPGNHSYRVRWRYNDGSLSAPSTAISGALAADRFVRISSLTTSYARGGIGWQYERTKAGTTTPFYVVAKGTESTYDDRIADAALTELSVDRPMPVMLMGGDVGGLWRSTNRGRSWVEKGQWNTGVTGRNGANGVFNRTNVSALDYDPRSDSIVVYTGIDGRLIRSTDGGNTFHATVIDSGTISTPAEWIASISVCKTIPNVVYAIWHSAFNDQNNGTTGHAEIYKSTNRGLTWWRMMQTTPTAEANRFPSSRRLLKIQCDPSDSSTVYVCTGSDRYVDHRTDPTKYQLFKSTDGGRSWAALTIASADITGEGVTDFILHPTKPDTVWATTFAGSMAETYTGHVWQSTDKGATWNAKFNRTGALAALSNNPNEPRLMLVDVVKDVPLSSDAGDTTTISAGTWTAVSPYTSWSRLDDAKGWGYGHSGYLDDPSDPNGTGDYAHSPSQRGIANSLTVSYADSQTVMWTTSQWVYSMGPNGLFTPLFTDSVAPGPSGPGRYSAKSWYNSRNLDNTIVTALASHGDWVYAGCWDIGLWRSRDRGASWQSCNDTVLTGRNQSILLTGSPDGAWQGHGGANSTILADPQNGTVWANLGTGKDRTSLGRSTMRGQPGSWSIVGSTVVDSLVMGLSMDPRSAPGRRTLYCTTMGDVARSMDDGVTWSIIKAHGLREGKGRMYISGDCTSGGSVCGSARDTTGVYYTAVDYSGNLWAGGPVGLFKCADPTAAAPTFTQTQPINWDYTTGTPISGSAMYDFRHRGVHDIVARREGVYVTISGNGQARGAATAADSFGVYFTPDGGTSWKKIHVGTYDDRFVIDGAGRYWVSSRSVGNAGGLTQGTGLQMNARPKMFTTTGGSGDGWMDVGGGLPWPSYSPMMIDPKDASYIIVGIPGGAFFRADLPGSRAFAPSTRR